MAMKVELGALGGPGPVELWGDAGLAYCWLPGGVKLGGENFNHFWNFHPNPWGDDPILTCAYFSNGLKLNHQLENLVPQMV